VGAGGREWLEPGDRVTVIGTQAWLSSFRVGAATRLRQAADRCEAIDVQGRSDSPEFARASHADHAEAARAAARPRTPRRTDALVHRLKVAALGLGARALPGTRREAFLEAS
jgi:hypothetical protein